MSGKSLRIFRKFHKWPGIAITLFVILFASSGIVMNHRNWFSSVEVNRSWLHKSYEYNNWNLAAVKSVCYLNGDSALIYGNIGVWLSTDRFQTFEDFNQGFPPGIDNRKINKLIYTEKGNLFAGTYFGIYQYSFQKQEWEKMILPVSEERITDIAEVNGDLLVQTRSYLLRSRDGENFAKIDLPPPAHFKKEASLFKTFWLLHSGELFGTIGKLLVDLFGIVLVAISVTGLLHFIFPKILRRRKKENKSIEKLKPAIKTNLGWHNKLGYIFTLFLMITTITGMFLRPPLLIPIANTTVKPIQGTILNEPNPWFDKLRRVWWDDERRIFLFATSEGIYFADASLENELIKSDFQPPVSVMGCNVLEKKGDDYLVGSFSGLFLWNPFNGKLIDYTTGLPFQAPQKAGPPVSKDMVDGFFTDNYGQEFLFDYNRGVLPMGQNQRFPEMPEQIKRECPISLWNVSLEIHTGRIFEPYIGPFYILYIPLAGICILLVLISGFLIWWKTRKKKD